MGEGEGVGVGWDYGKFHPDYNKMQSPALCSGRVSEGGRRPSERWFRTIHIFELSMLLTNHTISFCSTGEVLLAKAAEGRLSARLQQIT